MTELGLLETLHVGADVTCSDKVCTRPIRSSDKCWIDLLRGGGRLCDACGVCVRYHRKKARERGELPEHAETD